MIEMIEVIESPDQECESVVTAVMDIEPSETHPPTHQEIAALAYSYWEARGYQGGSPEEDWFRAEQELCGQPGLKKT